MYIIYSGMLNILDTKNKRLGWNEVTVSITKEKLKKQSRRYEDTMFTSTGPQDEEWKKKEFLSPTGLRSKCGSGFS